MATALVAPPHGRDTSATDSVQYGRWVSDAVLVAEACFRRLTTERGTLQSIRSAEAKADAANYGFLLSSLIEADMTDAEVEQIPSKVRNEIGKDDRLDMQATVIRATRATNDAGDVEVEVQIDGVTTEGETFELSLHVDDVSVEILRLEVT